MSKSIETSVKQWSDDKIRALGHKKIGSENLSIDESIDESLKNNPSKLNGEGGGIPDYTLIISNGEKNIPVFIEYKGTKNKLEKLDKQNLLVLRNDNDEFAFKNIISKYATNGAAYYASNLAKDNNEYSEVLAVGVNGFEKTSTDIQYEISAYIINKNNPELPIKLGNFDNFNFLKNTKEDKERLFSLIEEVQLNPKEIEQRTIRDENKIEKVLQDLNNKLHAEHQIEPSQRINIVAGMLMAAVGVKDKNGDYKVTRLFPEELSGSNEDGNTDGEKILTKIKNFLKERNLPYSKQKQILNVLQSNFVNNNLNQKNKNETKTPLKNIYQEIFDKLIPVYDVSGINDFTGRLFNVMNSWVSVPDGSNNDVVLTPRYITEFMAKISQVNMDSYVWDWALGSGGFLISAMNLMISDAKTKYHNDREKEFEKIENIKNKQLLGVELLPNVYILAVLNMILMGDGSSNIVNDDSIENYEGKYAYNDEPFPADRFLLNPPYSKPGNGMIFVEEAFKKQKNGFGAVIIQDSAGSGKATDYNRRILKNNKLKASIKMPGNLFKASVQTSIYLFEVGTPHNENDNVLFFDLRDDGYKRTNRKKSKNNLVNHNDASGHYQEVVDIILDKNKKTNYFIEGNNYYKETIDPKSGNDWNYIKKTENFPTEEDFQDTVRDYISFEINQILKETEESF